MRLGENINCRSRRFHCRMDCTKNFTIKWKISAALRMPLSTFLLVLLGVQDCLKGSSKRARASKGEQKLGLGLRACSNAETWGHYIYI